jgi:peptide/nickel transport system permease protein
MIGFLLRRIAWSFLVVGFVITTTFAMIMLVPADPARTLMGPHASQETLQKVRAQYCLDKGFVGQYGCYLDNIVHGDLGESYRTHKRVGEIIADRFWATAQLALAAVFLQLGVALPLGIWAAVRRNRWPDTASGVITLVGQSAPTFFIATIAVYVLAYRLGWFPVAGYGSGFWGRLHHLVLPAMTLATVGVAYYARVIRGEMIETLGQDYVRTARAKGVSERAVVLRHGLRNALGPVVTLVGLDLGVLMGGAVVTETVFAWPGLGREVLQAILDLDIPLILGVTLVTAIAIVTANLVVDLVYAWLDPRVRLE